MSSRKKLKRWRRWLAELNIELVKRECIFCFKKVPYERTKTLKNVFVDGHVLLSRSIIQLYLALSRERQQRVWHPLVCRGGMDRFPPRSRHFVRMNRSANVGYWVYYCAICGYLQICWPIAGRVVKLSLVKNRCFDLTWRGPNDLKSCELVSVTSFRDWILLSRALTSNALIFTAMLYVIYEPFARGRQCPPCLWLRLMRNKPHMYCLCSAGLPFHALLNELFCAKLWWNLRYCKKKHLPRKVTLVTDRSQ